MTSDVPGELLLMLLADARLPVAGHTQSGGLEPAMAAGLTVADVPGYCRTRLATVTLVDAATAVVSRHAVSRHAALEAAGLADKLTGIEQAWAARTPSDAMRATSRLMARGLLRLSTRLWPEAAALRIVAGMAQPPRPIVLGVIAAECGLSAERLAYLVGYDDVQTVTSAALKLHPVDPAQTTGWVLDLLPDIHAMAERVAGLEASEAMPAPAAPLLEQWAQAHARTTRRLFSA